ncbi:MAG TPA: hypothetical protein VFO87_04195 [Nitrospira sp.]|nr:hypothetical protein [Nitrospira sp.]
MKLYRGKALVGVTVVLVLLLAPVGAAQSEDIVLGSHYGFSGVISKIESGMLFIKTDSSLQPRPISPNKADRVGLYNAKVGDPVNILVDSGNVLIDASATDQSPEHVFVVGTVRYSDPFWHEIQLSTPEGTTTYEVDSLAGTKLSGFADGAPATLELDADNVMIDIQHGQSR